MCDQALKSVLVPLNQVGSKAVFGPCSRVTKTVRSILHLSLVQAIPWWDLRHFYCYWFSFLVHNSWDKQPKGCTAICQCGAFTATEVVSYTLGYLDASEGSAWWCSVRCLRVAKGVFLWFSSTVLEIILRSCLVRCLSVTRGKHQRILVIEQDGQLVAQYPGQPCGSVSVEFLRPWGAASPATIHLVLSGHSKVGEVGWNSWCTVRAEEGDFSRLVVRTSAK